MAWSLGCFPPFDFPGSPGFLGGPQYCGLWSLTSKHRQFNCYGNSYAGLIPGELLRLPAAARLPLDPLLLVDDRRQPLEILPDAGLLRFQPLGAVLAQQQLQQGLQVLLDPGLVLDRAGKLVLLEQVDERLELDADHPLLALRHGLAKEGCAARVRCRAQLGHAQQHFFQPLVPIADTLLLQRELVVGPDLHRGRSGVGLRGFRRFPRRGGRLRADGRRNRRQDDPQKPRNRVACSGVACSHDAKRRASMDAASPDYSRVEAFRRRVRHTSPTRKRGQLVAAPSLALRASVWP